jgi:beta-galactosidase
MKKEAGICKSKRSRRSFIRTIGYSIAGLGFMRTSVFASANRSKRGIQPSGSALNSFAPLQSDTILPDGVKAVWDISRAFHETTPTRERICINGLWKWQPCGTGAGSPPAANFGYIKVPGNWPGKSNYMQKDNQRIYPHPSWQDQPFDNINAAWYQREISIPPNWINRRILLRLEYLNSSAIVFVDGNLKGEILFPAGELDLTSVCTPGSRYTISLKVTAMPLQDVVAVYNDSNAPRQGKGVVARRGLCGDVYLISTPVNARIGDVRVLTSVLRGEITLLTAIENLATASSYYTEAVITQNGENIHSFKSRIFKASDLVEGQLSVTEQWKPAELWDIHTPGNILTLTVSLFEMSNKLSDKAFPTRFGFREFRIEGRDFYLNGTRLFLSAVPFDNAQIGAALANYEGARESMRRLKSFGINFVYTHNYGCEPGTHLSFEEILKAADDEGMLISLSQPHFGQYDWTSPDADRKNGYALHARFYTHVAGNHPSVVFYSMSHNATGYTDDMNPDMIDGLSRTDSQWSQNNVRKALRAEAIVSALDPGRIVYHHSSGNLSPMHTSNFYPNWVPIQEMNDWFEHWATAGVKPLFLCEFGAPFTWDWAAYRGWYKGKREFGSALVPWEFCLAEWNAQFLGDRAYNISEQEKANLRWEAERFRAGAVWSRSDYPYNFDSRLLEERNPVFAMHIADNWRAFRTWSLSVNSPWHHSPYWKEKDGITNKPVYFTTDWENLQRPGMSPDLIGERAGRMDLDVGNDRSDWIPNAAGDALISNNMPLLAWIGGKSASFTSKDHNFFPGSKFGKQMIIINNSRQPVECDCSWSADLPVPVSGNKSIRIETGCQQRIPVELELPSSLPPGEYTLNATARFSNGDVQKDSFMINVLPGIVDIKYNRRTALFDPAGQTGRMLDGIGIKYQTVGPGDDLAAYEILIIGKEAITIDGQVPDIGRVRKGLRVILFEQTSSVLEKRLGFRVQEYGLRRVYKRLADHPALEGLSQENLHDWKGSATILDPRLKYEVNSNIFNGVQTVRWCDIPVTRIWRCGNRGNVASVLIEKPTCGNFLPLTDGGYSLQYSPLMEYREGSGMILFCQMDVTGRTEDESAARQLVSNIISYVSDWKPGNRLQTIYSGDPEGLHHLEKAGMNPRPYDTEKPGSQNLLVAGPGSSRQLMPDVKSISKWIKAGGYVLAAGLGQDEVNNFLPFKVTMEKQEYISSFFGTFKTNSFFSGIGPADLHNRAPKEIPLVTSGAQITGNGVLARAENLNVAFCQLVPWLMDYGREQHNVKQTLRRSSFMLNRLLGNMGADSSTPLIERFGKPVDAGKNEKRWLNGLYHDIPEEWDDPYRFFRW